MRGGRPSRRLRSERIDVAVTAVAGASTRRLATLTTTAASAAGAPFGGARIREGPSCRSATGRAWKYRASINRPRAVSLPQSTTARASEARLRARREPPEPPERPAARARPPKMTEFKEDPMTERERELSNELRTRGVRKKTAVTLARAAHGDGDPEEARRVVDELAVAIAEISERLESPEGRRGWTAHLRLPPRMPRLRRWRPDMRPSRARSWGVRAGWTVGDRSLVRRGRKVLRARGRLTLDRLAAPRS